MPGTTPSWSPTEVRPGQRRRGPDGTIVTVDSIDDDTVQGTYKPPEAPIAIGTSAWSVNEISGYTLVDEPGVPHWRVSAPWPWTEEVVATLSRVGTVQGKHSHEPTERGLEEGDLWIDVVAPSADDARRLAADADSSLGKNARPDAISVDRA